MLNAKEERKMLNAKDSEKNKTNKPNKPINRPVEKWRLSNWEICVWENKKDFNGGETIYKTVTLTKSFKKRDEDIWRSEVINNIRRNDLVKLRLLLNKAEEYLYFDVIEKEDEDD
ncbi:MAG: hypothetical protein V1663_00105 [archaeon]